MVIYELLNLHSVFSNAHCYCRVAQGSSEKVFKSRVSLAK